VLPHQPKSDEIDKPSRLGSSRRCQPPRRVLVRLSVLCAVVVVGCNDPLDQGQLDPETTRTRFQEQGDDTVTSPWVSALLGTQPKRTRTAAALLFDIGSPPNKTNVANLVMGPGTSLTRMYNEISFGLQQLQVDIYGPYTLPVKNCLTIACCGPKSDRTGNGATVQSLIDALPMKYDHYFWDYGIPLPAGANCGTWGDEGTPATPAAYSSYSFQGIVGQAQELGHNLGMTHEPTLICAGAKTFLNDTSQCTHVEYGSSLSFMGGGAHHPSAYHKYAQGWIGKCNVVSVGTSGTFNLVPQEVACNGAQLLQIAAPMVRPAPAKGDRQGTGPMLSNYYLEMRAPIGFDSSLKPMVVISIGAGLPTVNAPAPYLYVLDMLPESGRADLTNAGLMTVGQSYADPAGGLTITLMSISATMATVSVTTNATGANTCVDATPFSAPGPDGTSCAPVTSSDGGTSSMGGATGAGGTMATVGTGGVNGGSGSGGRIGTGGSVAGTGGVRSTGGTGGTGGRAGAGTGASSPPGIGGGAVSTGGRSTGTGGAIASNSSSGGTGLRTGTGGDVATATGGAQVALTSGSVTGCACSLDGADGPSLGLGPLLLGAGQLFRRRRARRAR
jgi:MYXO-CTERM domain-containing protein